MCMWTACVHKCTRVRAREEFHSRILSVSGVLGKIYIRTQKRNSRFECIQVCLWFVLPFSKKMLPFSKNAAIQWGAHVENRAGMKPWPPAPRLNRSSVFARLGIRHLHVVLHHQSKSHVYTCVWCTSSRDCALQTDEMRERRRRDLIILYITARLQ